MKKFLLLIICFLLSYNLTFAFDEYSYWLNMWNKYNTPNDNGSWTSQAALNLGKFYKNKGLYDNAIIWFNRAGEKYKLIYGNRKAVPYHIAQAYIRKGNCTASTFDLYREAINNMLLDNEYQIADKISQEMLQADYYCTMR